MGLITGEFPPVEPATFMQTPYRERIKTLSRHWAEYGFGAPKITAVIYIVKLLVLYLCGGVAVASLTSGLNPFHVSVWFDQPIMWQKAVIWTVLLESVGIAGSWGPLAGHFKPMTGGILYWARPGTVKLPPWPDKVPFTKGEQRTLVDVALYVAFLLSLVVALVLPGVSNHGVSSSGGYHGLISTWALIPVIVLLVAVGLRDKIIFLAARSEQYLPALVMFAFFPFLDMIVGAKLLILSSWMGASVSKMNHHFGNVIPVMISNTPWLSSKRIKRLHYRNFPEDLRPSKLALRLAHGPGTLAQRARQPPQPARPDRTDGAGDTPLNADTRSWIKQSIDELGVGLGPEGSSFRRALVELAPFLAAAKRLTSVTAVRQAQTARLIHNFELVTAELGRRDVEVRQLVSAGASTLSELGGRETSVQAVVSRLPPTMRQLESTFATVRTTADHLDPAFEALQPVAVAMPAGLRGLARFGTAAEPAFAKLLRPLPSLNRLVKALRPTASGLRSSLHALAPVPAQLNDITGLVVPCEPALAKFFQNTISLGKFQSDYSVILRGETVLGISSGAGVINDQTAAKSCAPGGP